MQDVTFVAYIRARWPKTVSSSWNIDNKSYRILSHATSWCCDTYMPWKPSQISILLFCWTFLGQRLQFHHQWSEITCAGTCCISIQLISVPSVLLSYSHIFSFCNIFSPSSPDSMVFVFSVEALALNESDSVLKKSSTNNKTSWLQ